MIEIFAFQLKRNTFVLVFFRRSLVRDQALANIYEIQKFRLRFLTTPSVIPWQVPQMTSLNTRPL